MTDRLDQRVAAGPHLDGVYQQVVLSAPHACARWAHSEVTGELDVLLWPRDRGDYPVGVPYRVTQRVVQRGWWRVTLCPEGELPDGVALDTRDAAVQAQIALNALGTMTYDAIDQVVQCGLFGEVLYR